MTADAEKNGKIQPFTKNSTYLTLLPLINALKFEILLEF